MSRARRPSTPSSGSIQNGLIRLGSASAALSTCTAQPRWNCRSLAACITYGASTIHLTPPERSEGRRVGKECVSPCRSRVSPHHYKKHNSEHIVHKHNQQQ